MGGPDTFAGRVMLLVDGIPAVDNIYDQVYLGHDAIIDVALIERIEYAPGSGSAMYGNNAFLGVINVITKRGRDFNGVQASVARGRWSERDALLSWGQRLPNGAEWLLSATLQGDSGISSPAIGAVFDDATGRSQKLFFKGRWQGFSLQAMGAQRRTDKPFPGGRHVSIDRNEFISIGHDGTLPSNWTSSLRLHAGRYAFRGRDDLDTGEWGVTTNDGRWWSLDGQLGYDGLSGHRLVLGARVRRDPQAEARYWAVNGMAGASEDPRRGVGVSVEDEITLSPQWRTTIGLRVERRTYSQWTRSPRAALVWEPAADWQLKLSHGRATRSASVAERDFGDSPVQDEHVTTSELVGEYRRDGLRLLSSLYRYRIDDLISFASSGASVRGRGLELEAEWQWHGWRLRGSQAWQETSWSDGTPSPFAPRTVSKLQFSVPLAGERLRASVAVRRHADYRDEYGFDIPSRTLLDFTLASLRTAGPFDVRLGWRNVLGRPDRLIETWGRTVEDRPTKHLWVELTGSFE
jgi:iron complex outermembrane receptor protein